MMINMPLHYDQLKLQNYYGLKNENKQKIYLESVMFLASRFCFHSESVIIFKNYS